MADLVKPEGVILLTYSQVASQLQISVRSVKRLVARRLLRVVAIGHRTKRFRPCDVARCLAKLSGDVAEF